MSGPARRRGGERRLRHDLAGVVRKKHPPEDAERAVEAALLDDEAMSRARSLVAWLRLHLPREVVGDVAHALIREALKGP